MASEVGSGIGCHVRVSTGTHVGVVVRLARLKKYLHAAPAGEALCFLVDRTYPGILSSFHNVFHDGWKTRLAIGAHWYDHQAVDGRVCKGNV